MCLHTNACTCIRFHAYIHPSRCCKCWSYAHHYHLRCLQYFSQIVPRCQRDQHRCVSHVCFVVFSGAILEGLHMVCHSRHSLPGVCMLKQETKDETLLFEAVKIHAFALTITDPTTCTELLLFPETRKPPHAWMQGSTCMDGKP